MVFYCGCSIILFLLNSAAVSNDSMKAIKVPNIFISGPQFLCGNSESQFA
jgi:hypothetical protein